MNNKDLGLWKKHSGLQLSKDTPGTTFGQNRTTHGTHEDASVWRQSAAGGRTKCFVTIYETLSHNYESHMCSYYIQMHNNEMLW